MYKHQSSRSADGAVRLLTFGAVVVAIAVVVGIVVSAQGSARAGGSDGGGAPSQSPVVTPSPSSGQSASAPPSQAPSDAPEPTEQPSAKPSAQPTERPSVEPSPEPTESPRDAMPITVDLEVATPHHVYVDIVDRPGVVVDARSGPASAGASVAWGELRVENVDERTLQLTWVDRPGDNGLVLYIWREGETVRLVLVQPPHDEGGDAIVHDRVLIVELDEPVSAEGLDAVLVERLDAPGG